MSCSQQHGPQVFVGFISDSSGETISQQDWHDVRLLAGEAGADMSRERVSAQDAISALRNLDARIKSDAAESVAVSPSPESKVPESMDDIAARFLGDNDRTKVAMEEMKTRVAAAFVAPTADTSAAPELPVPAVSVSAESELLVAKVTQGTLSVVRLFVGVGVKPPLDYVRARRAEQQLIKRGEKRASKILKNTRNR